MHNTEAYQIVHLSIDDVAAMVAVENQAHTHPWTEAVIADCFGPLYRIIGIKQQGELLGFAIVQQIIDEATLLDICVAPANQGQGLGLLLIRHLLTDAKQAEAVVMMLEVRESNTAAKSLYEKVGFAESGRRKNYYQTSTGNEDAILMDKAL
ncbi:ribosomal protein S18-alanine N-acetyltransferase [Shewanella inventionis]|uniref:[Ribosomal protein bS18]-alanine N-acetyltransferase n=1 Tax=Shewanella inventionis TaxID=1738770 RepID=A0ABQ1J902_9GAMM|nr:ribosomal protein S18-alanine N-acetyltransferase [Shewanella inventionis]GGB60785.1 ribosomal-protein-alanine acetyltransferase [Shewanella inventionis]